MIIGGCERIWRLHEGKFEFLDYRVKWSGSKSNPAIGYWELWCESGHCLEDLSDVCFDQPHLLGRFGQADSAITHMLEYVNNMLSFPLWAKDPTAGERDIRAAIDTLTGGEDAIAKRHRQRVAEITKEPSPNDFTALD